MTKTPSSGDSPPRPIITAFENSPDRGRGMARDMPVRWALEETGRDYDMRLVSFEAMKARPHLDLQPFGQLPTNQQGHHPLFESGAILIQIQENNP
ncbi:MAG: glutathione S-transferase family protein, partial [Brucella intermedia]